MLEETGKRLDEVLVTAQKKEGLLHISEISWKRLETMEGIFKEGDKVKVKLLDIDQKTGKFKLSRKALIPKPEMQPRPQQGEQQA